MPLVAAALDFFIWTSFKFKTLPNTTQKNTVIVFLISSSKEQEQLFINCLDVWCKNQVSGCFVSHLPSRIWNVNPLWNVSASDSRQQASVYVCVHDSVVFLLCFITLCLLHNVVRRGGGKTHNKSACRQRRARERGLGGSFDVEHVLFKTCLTQALLPACCRATELVYTGALFALSSPCFWRGWKSSVLFPANASGHKHTHYAHTHTHTHHVSWRLPVAGRFILPLLSLSLCLSISCSLVPALLFPF